MAIKSRSRVVGIKEETTEGTLKALSAGGDFTVIREGFSMSPGLETVQSDELVDDIGASAPFTTKEAPTCSFPKYFKHSGTEGQAPDWALLLKAAMGSQTDNSTEYDTVAGATAGSSSARATVDVDTGEGSNFSEGQALLIKDGTNGYSIRNVRSISTDTLTLNYNLDTAPSSGVNLGKAIHFSPSASGHPTYSVHAYQASDSASKFYEAMAGCRTTNVSVEIQANGLATIGFDIGGTAYYMNPIVIDSSNKYLDFDEGGTELTATLEEKTYKDPKALASEIETKMDAAGTDDYTVTFDSTTGKFTIASDGATLNLKWNTGTNTANTVGDTIGFTTTADDGSATSYTSDNDLTYGPDQTPSFDDIDPFVCKSQELMIGDYHRADLRKFSSLSFTLGTPKTDVEDATAETGVSESVINERTASFSATLVMQEHEVDDFHDMINNSTSQIMFNGGNKDSSGNWTPGKAVNIWFPQMKFTTHTISESDGLHVIEVEGSGFVSTDLKDIHINLL